MYVCACDFTYVCMYVRMYACMYVRINMTTFSHFHS